MLAFKSSKAFISVGSRREVKGGGNRKRKLSAADQTNLSKKSKKTHPGVAKAEDCVGGLLSTYNLAMAVFKKYCPGLGHDGEGLYGTLTNNSLSNIMKTVRPTGKCIVDVGAADGKVLLAGLAFQARSALGIELAGDSLVTKFNAMVNSIKNKTMGAFPTQNQSACLKCNTDILKFENGSMTDLLTQCFPGTFRMRPGRSIVVCAVWHGFTIKAKESLLKRLANSHFVQSFTVVGPQLKDYGKSTEVLDFLKQQNPKCTAHHVSSIPVTLSGGGEHYQAMYFEY